MKDAADTNWGWTLPDYKVVDGWAVPIEPLTTIILEQLYAPKGKLCKEITLAVSERYNGGTVVNNEWCQGFKIPRPTMPEGYKLYSSWGANLNARPPQMTYRIIKEEKGSDGYAPAL